MTTSYNNLQSKPMGVNVSVDSSCPLERVSFNYDNSLSKHMSNGINMQHVLKMYSEEIQNNYDDGQNTPPHLRNDSLIISEENNNASYRNNLIESNDITQLEKTNNIILNHRDIPNNSCLIENPNSSPYIKLPISSTNEYSPQAKQYITCNRRISGEPNHSLLTVDYNSANKINKKGTYDVVSQENNNNIIYYNSSTKKSVQCIPAEQKNSKRNSSFNEHPISCDSEFPNNTQDLKKPLNSVDKKAFHNIFCSYNCKNIFPFDSCLLPSNDSNSLLSNQDAADDHQLNYSLASSSCATFRKDIIDDLDTPSTKTTNILLTKNISEHENTNEEEISSQFCESFNGNHKNSMFDHFAKFENTNKASTKNINDTLEKEVTLTLNEMFYKEFLEKSRKTQMEKNSTVNAMSKESDIIGSNVKFISSESFKKNTNNIPVEDRKPKTYSLADIRSGKVKMPQTIFKPLPYSTQEDNVMNTYEKNRKLQNFMNNCNDSVNLILKYPKVQKKQTKTIAMPARYASTISNKIGIPIVNIDNFDRKNYHPNVTSLHTKGNFEKHVFNILKNKKDLGKKLFTESGKFDKYNYENGKGFWMSNIDKDRLVNPELNDSYVTELVYEKENSYEKEMEVLKACKNYNSIVPPVQNYYKDNNFYKFLWKEKMCQRNVKPEIVTVMRRYDVEKISDYKIADLGLGVSPIYNSEENQ